MRTENRAQCRLGGNFPCSDSRSAWPSPGLSVQELAFPSCVSRSAERKHGTYIVVETGTLPLPTAIGHVANIGRMLKKSRNTEALFLVCFYCYKEQHDQEYLGRKDFIWLTCPHHDIEGNHHHCRKLEVRLIKHGGTLLIGWLHMACSACFS